MSSAIKKDDALRHIRNFVPASTLTSTSCENFFESLDTPLSLSCCLLFKYGEHDQLLSRRCEPSDYLTAEAFHLDYCAVKFLSKSDFLKTGIDKKKKALDKFHLMEENCRLTNQRFLRDFEQKTHNHGHHLMVMRRKIELILGEFDIEEFFSSPAWGPGVSTLIKGEDVSAARKFQSETGITEKLYSHVREVLPLVYPLWFEPGRESETVFAMEAGNAVTTVPKNSKIDRVIAIEPGLNLFFQKAIGSMIRRRLKVWGVDLNSQKRNQDLSRVGSVQGTVATVDFSSASDTISYEVVRNLLPTRWFTMLDITRSGRGRIGKESFLWEKFSSMGNGFTFELESLLFFVCALASCEANGDRTKDVSVFGDDVIIPSNSYHLFSEISEMLGFIVNKEKSFSLGPFRESCGSHFFRGVDVKPIFFKGSLNNALCIYKLANSIRRLAHRRCFNNGCDRRFLSIWRNLVHRLPPALRSVKVAEGFGDGGLLSNFDEACPHRVPDGYEGYYTNMFAERGMKIPHESRGLLLSRLHSLGLAIKDIDFERPVSYLRQGRDLSTIAYRNTETLRGRTKISFVKRVIVSQWYDLGSWI